ncbi:hypothetical protein BDU57DRAFT_559241 [Ampelomyces quisqualis]|uniref:AhpC/TSA antioxidant enzyme-domain-containing protein n=1 Tax=Ampelomyces quisqualis TaxID=50730 RepID=A0A6A5QCP2_AMPQU|nr:hypothetical protein BDU57DRAFT_559241 [Ampelomyces quisqualis]
MTSPLAQAPDASTPPTPAELSAALEIEVYDQEGHTKTLGEVVQGRRTALIFIRHFWCLNCQAYVRCLSEAVPPSNLPTNVQADPVLVIGCGSYQPIKTYAEQASSLYPIYTDPSLRLHKIFRFKSNLSEGSGAQRDYMRNAGGMVSRIVGGIKGALGNLQHLNHTGPKALNGGEVVVSAEGECEYIYRMQNTVDHTDISRMAELLGAKYLEPGPEAQDQKVCEDAGQGGKPKA